MGTMGTTGTAERVEIIFRYPSFFVVFAVPILLKLSKFTISALLAIIKTLEYFLVFENTFVYL